MLHDLLKDDYRFLAMNVPHFARNHNFLKFLSLYVAVENGSPHLDSIPAVVPITDFFGDKSKANARWVWENDGYAIYSTK